MNFSTLDTHKQFLLCIQNHKYFFFCILLVNILFASCAQKKESQSITLIPTPLFDERYKFILVKDNYARAFASRNNNKEVITVFRRGTILPLVKNDAIILPKEANIGFMWYKVTYKENTLWLYARDIMFCRSMSEALLFKNRFLLN